MAPGPDNIDAAPNLCQIEVKVVSLTPSTEFPDKVELIFELLGSTCLDGPDFISRHIGERLNGFTFEAPDLITQGALLSAKASFIGGPTGGVFHLFDVKPSP